jgi:hypothetical protein
MKKFFITAIALMFALGLTVSAQAQGAAEKSKAAPAQVQKAATPEMAPQNTKTEATKATPAAEKKNEPTVTGKKDKEKAATDKTTAKEVKTSAVEGKKPGPEATKADK